MDYTALLQTFCYLLSLGILLYFCFSEREISHAWRRRDAASMERERTARNIVMETYKRHYHAGGYVHKREILINLLDLLNVYNIGSCKEALEKPLDAADESTDS